jgi:hypothetical protein
MVIVTVFAHCNADGEDDGWFTIVEMKGTNQITFLSEDYTVTEGSPLPASLVTEMTTDPYFEVRYC